MLTNAYLLAKIGVDTAENEQHFAEILPIGRRVADRCKRPGAPRGAILQKIHKNTEIFQRGAFSQCTIQFRSETASPPPLIPTVE